MSSISPRFGVNCRRSDKMYGQRIRELRIEKGLTQTQLAEQLGLTQKSVSKYELEQLDLSTELVVKISRFFEVSADYLLGMSDDY